MVVRNSPPSSPTIRPPRMKKRPSRKHGLTCKPEIPCTIYYYSKYEHWCKLRAKYRASVPEAELEALFDQPMRSISITMSC